MQFTRGSLHASRRIVLLAPHRTAVPKQMARRAQESHDYSALMASMQRLRGDIYLRDGAIKPWQLTADGRHVTETDETSWHVLIVDCGKVSGCARYTPYPHNAAFTSLGVSRCALAQSDEWGSRLRLAVEQEMNAARRDGLACVEVGGWALAEELRGTAEALRVAMASYALAHLLGGCLGLCTATHRHHSSSILRRIGGRPLQASGVELPPYYDPAYECQMELLRFDSRHLSGRYQSIALDLAQELAAASVYAPPMNESLYSLANHLQQGARVGSATERAHAH
jgi:hypothetical protein